MATGEPSSTSEDQNPHPTSPEYVLEVVIVDDEIPGQSGLWGESNLAPRACNQKKKRKRKRKRKREWSPLFEEEQDHMQSCTAGVTASPSYHMPQGPVQEKQRNSSSSQLEIEEEQKEVFRLPPRKRWRHYMSLFGEDPQESSHLSPLPLTHLGITEKVCDLKKERKMKHLSSVLPEHHAAFTRLLEDPVIKRYLAGDVYLRGSDKYLLAMVIVYFCRAGLSPSKYQRIHFFLALYLANDMEEDSEHQKLEMFSYLYGSDVAQIPKFRKLRYEFIKCMDWNLWVTRQECEEIHAYDPGLWVWKRDRKLMWEALEF